MDDATLDNESSSDDDDATTKAKSTKKKIDSRSNKVMDDAALDNDSSSDDDDASKEAKKNYHSPQLRAKGSLRKPKKRKKPGKQPSRKP